MLGHNPDRLQNLAVDVFGDYVTNVVQNWLCNCKSHDFKWMELFSRNLHTALCRVMLPSHVANEVTMKLLTQMDMMIGSKKVQKTARILSLTLSPLISSLVHPSVTHLNFLDTETYYMYGTVIKLLSQVVTEMKMLKVLQLKYKPCFLKKFSFPNLQELTLLDVCDDNLLQFLLVTCGKIRKLDISESTLVTDKGVQFLVKFKNLEVLNIMGTDISEDGFTQLITGLSKNRDSEGVSLLKSYSCDDLSEEEFQILVNHFQKLAVLEISANLDVNDLKLLRNLKHLRRLRVPHFRQLEATLEVIGHQLSHLEGGVFESDELCYISRYCPSLVYLNLTNNSYAEDFEEITPLPSFKSLEVVDLRFDFTSNMMASILSHCTNARVIKINCNEICSDEVATVMLQNNPLEHLEELHWWAKEYPLLPKVGHKIVEHCKNLRVMYGNIWWSRCRSRKPWFGKNGLRPPLDYVTRVHPQFI